MLESIVFVIRRLYWEAPDESHDEWLKTSEAAPSGLSWTRKSVEAYQYQSVAVFGDVAENGGGVFLRTPSGREIAINEADFSPLWDQKAVSDSRLRRHQ